MTNKEAQLAIANLKRYISGGGAVDRNTNKAIDMAIEALGKPEPHWIPVTERLPEKSGRYYVTEWVYHIDDKKHEGKHTKRVNFAEYSATEKKWRRAQALVVVAWMDNEPYKGVIK